VPRYLFSITAYSIGVFIIFLSTVPLQLPLKEIPSFEIDKAAHAFAYFCFAMSVFVALNLDWKLKTARKWTIISGFSLGLLLEIVQGSLLSYRSFEVYDLLANTLGIVFFLFLSKRVKKLLSKAVFL
jgi:VanZ family protein